MTEEALDKYTDALLNDLALPDDLKEMWTDVVWQLTKDFNFTWRGPIDENLHSLLRIKPFEINAGTLRVSVPDDLLRWADNWRLAMLNGLEIGGHPELEVEIVPAAFAGKVAA